jgi:hypothetical protein
MVCEEWSFLHTRTQTWKRTRSSHINSQTCTHAYEYACMHAFRFISIHSCPIPLEFRRYLC